jgi:hypothetical protein
MSDIRHEALAPGDQPERQNEAERDGERCRATAAALRERILADPTGKAAYERAREEIEHHQASLAKVRKLRALAQATVAELMGMDQSEISRLERRTDLLLSTLRRFVAATGGQLRLVASYPDGDVELLIGPGVSDEEGSRVGRDPRETHRTPV